jgi:hypothetical protein
MKCTLCKAAARREWKGVARGNPPTPKGGAGNAPQPTKGELWIKTLGKN